uniref:Uncharacterized protein n=1 Tax=Arundo donax TaxID=35708 RepID=A0A0A9BZ77_ARUDO
MDLVHVNWKPVSISGPLAASLVHQTVPGPYDPTCQPQSLVEIAKNTHTNVHRNM